MEKINYPLLYFELKEDAVLGILVGTPFQVIHRDLRTVKSSLHEYLQKVYKKTGDYFFTGIKEPHLKIIKVSIRPTYRDGNGSFPLPFQQRIPVPVVYGEVEANYFECYLPLFNQNFYYYDPKQFDSLVQHFAVTILNQLPPERIFRFLQYPKPRLEAVFLRVNTDRTTTWGNPEYRRQYRVLNRLAEKYPYPRNIRRAISALPDAAWELDDKVGEVLNKILQTRSNVLIVGNHGVGKSAILKQAIRKITQRSKKEALPYSFWRIMPQRITASAKYLGEWEATVEALVEELDATNGILWVIDLVQILQVGGSGPEDSVAAFLLAYLQQGKLQMIGEATPQELDSMRRLLPGFIEHFQIVTIEELPEAKINSVLRQFVDFVKQSLRVTIQPEALSLAYRLLLRYYPYESFPGKGIKFLGHCASEANLLQEEVVDRQAVIRHFIRQTGMPELFLRDDLLLDTNELHQYFSHRIIGQPAAVNKLCEIVKIFKAGLNNPSRPIATLLFAGPTGVGKTASTKALADYFFGQGQRQSPLIRIDMSEFQHPGQISRLIGSGWEVGQLVKEVREKPFSVLLLDEVEKADPSVFDALLTVLDEGLLADSFGRITNFRNTIIIMTTNLGAGNRASVGFRQTTSEEKRYHSAIDHHFRPEFINRIDSIVVFNPLGKEEILKITRKELEELKLREGFTKRNLRIEFSDKVVEYLAQAGFDERYGARPLQRAIEQSLVTAIANWLLEKPDLADATIRVDYRKALVIQTLK